MKKVFALTILLALSTPNICAMMDTSPGAQTEIKQYENFCKAIKRIPGALWGACQDWSKDLAPGTNERSESTDQEDETTSFAMEEEINPLTDSAFAQKFHYVLGHMKKIPGNLSEAIWNFTETTWEPNGYADPTSCQYTWKDVMFKKDSQ